MGLRNSGIMDQLISIIQNRMGNWNQNYQIWETETVTWSKIGYQTGMKKSAGDSRSGADLTIEHRSKMVIQRRGQ